MAASFVIYAAIDVTVETQKGVMKISPYLYGRNIDKISGGSAELDSIEEAFINQAREAGVRFMRANNGNNATRYNWRKKMTVHQDWFNNVYSVDWSITAKKILDKLPGVDAMYAFQLTGWAASTNEYNFGDWNWKQEHGQNAKATLDLAGGGEVVAIHDELDASIALLSPPSGPELLASSPQAIRSAHAKQAAIEKPFRN